ncbi:hypothetical protein PR202_ga06810 [Eleusine coracana subsp. coracana]|uniref:Uncharacterized protein n=1 Tax=Eleusine coracana subsp. coracana TaxID=191504 RepID=A0AAV5BVU6_ELECO|nr:hypothetical protein PR202_ga06810 [Eleusine coracana subsp. coracana]
MKLTIMSLNDQIDVCLSRSYLKSLSGFKYYVDDPHIRKLGNVSGLLYMPKVINKIVRMTFYPRGGNSDAIRDYYWNIIDYIMQGQVFDVVLLMMKEIESYSMAVRTSLYYAPYIMSLILQKSNFPTRYLFKKHPRYQPFSSVKHELVAPPAAEGEEEEENVQPEVPQAPQGPQMPPPPQMDWSQFAPPPPAFFAGMTPYLDQYFQPVMQRFDQIQASSIEARNSYEAARFGEDVTPLALFHKICYSSLYGPDEGPALRRLGQDSSIKYQCRNNTQVMFNRDKTRVLKYEAWIQRITVLKFGLPYTNDVVANNDQRSRGGVAKVLMTEADGISFTFVNDLDVDQSTDNV